MTIPALPGMASPRPPPPFALAPYSSDLMLSAKEYLALIGLPAQALPSVLLAVKTHEAIRERVNRELRLTWQEQSKLIVHAPGIILDQKSTGICAVYSRTNQFPLSTLYYAVIGGRAMVGVLSEGLKLAIQSDPRILQFISTQQLPAETLGKSQSVAARSQVRFWTGESYDGMASIAVDGRAETDTLLARVETRAVNRAIRKALRIPIRDQEEAEE